MAAETGIEWCDSTWNPWIGCTQVSPACDHCYAAVSTPVRALGIEWGVGKLRLRTSAANWALPARWNRQVFMACSCGWRGQASECKGDPTIGCPRCGSTEIREARRRVFCASLADVFDNAVPTEWRVDLFRVIRSTPNLDWLLLTKRIGNVPDMLNECARFERERFGDLDLWQWLEAWAKGEPPANVWIGATICNQAEADRDIPKLLRVPAAVRFLSIEPMLGPVDLRWLITEPTGKTRTYGGKRQMELRSTGLLHWVIVGGESGPHARPMHPDWARSLRDECAAAGVPFLFKQHGEWIGVPDLRNLPEGGAPGFGAYDHCPHDMDAEAVRVGKKAAGRLLDGRIHHEFPRIAA